MVPTPKVAPLVCVEVKLATPQLSADVGAVQEAAAPQTPMSFDRLMSAGMPAMVGFSPSVTVTVKEAVVVFPAASVAE